MMLANYFREISKKKGITQFFEPPKSKNLPMNFEIKLISTVIINYSLQIKL